VSSTPARPAVGNQKWLSEIVWPHFWATPLLLVVSIILHRTMRAFIRVIGGDTVREMFFGPPPNVRPSPSPVALWSGHRRLLSMLRRRPIALDVRLHSLQ
jgi:hypothetical protein